MNAACSVVLLLLFCISVHFSCIQHLLKEEDYLSVVFHNQGNVIITHIYEEKKADDESASVILSNEMNVTKVEPSALSLATEANSFTPPVVIEKTVIPSYLKRVERKPFKANNNKFVIFRPSESGLANNLLGLVSAFVISALTKRQLCYTGNYAMHTVFTLYDYWGNEVQRKAIPPDAHSGMVEYNRCFTTKSPLSKSLMTKTLQSFVKGSHFVVSTNCPLFHYIVSNPENLRQLQELGLVESNYSPETVSFFLYSKILRTYVKPLPMIQQEVEQRLVNTTGRVVVGMHIRCGVPLADFKDQASFLALSDISTFYKCMKQKILKENAIVIVASDSTKAKTVIQNYLPMTEVRFTDKRITHTMTRFSKLVELSGLQSSFTDMLTLSKVDVLVGTKSSTFSLTAAAFKGEIPHIVKRGGKQCDVPQTVIYT